MDSGKIELCNRHECTGCFACEGVCPKIAIHKVKNEEGFEYPEINHELCIKCHSCQRACPVLTPVEKYQDGDVYAAWNKDENVRSKSSSGGMFSVFAEYILSEKGAVVGASMNDDNYVCHTVVYTHDELDTLRGSKYVQSILNRDLYIVMKSLLREGRKVLFCGTPCQVAAMRNVFKRYNGQLFLLDLVCHGVPSPVFFARFLAILKKKIPNLVSYQFRDYKNWLVCTNVNVNVNVNGIIYNRYLYGEPTFYQDAFLKGYLHRENCYHCQYASIRRVSDITLADFWGIGRYKSVDAGYKGGCSMVSVNTDLGHELMQAVSEQIYCERRNIQETIDGGNKQLLKPSDRPVERDTFYQDAFRISYKKLITKYHLQLRIQATFMQKLKRKIKSFIDL